MMGYRTVIGKGFENGMVDISLATAFVVPLVF